METSTGWPRLLVFSPRYWPLIGGGQVVAHALAQRLSDRFATTVVRLHDEWIAPEQVAWWGLLSERETVTADGAVQMVQLAVPPGARRVLGWLRYRCPRVRGARLAFALGLFYALRGALARAFQASDLVHVYPLGGALFTALVVSLARQVGRPVVLTPFIHVPYPGKVPRTHRATMQVLAPLSCRMVDAVITMTAYERSWLVRRGVRPERCWVIPAGPGDCQGGDAAGFRQRYGLGEAPIVLFLGRLSRWKGWELVMAAAPQVWAVYPATRFVFAGPPGLEPASPLVRDPRLVWLGLVPAAEKRDVLAACDLLCLPSVGESLGLVYLEAWANQKPVIAADLPALREVISDGVDGLLVPPTPAAVAGAIRAMLADPGWAATMGAAGARKVQQCYSWEATAAQVATLYQQLLFRCP